MSREQPMADFLYKESPLFSAAPDPGKSLETITRFGPVGLSIAPVADKDGTRQDVSNETLAKDSSKPLIIRLNAKELSDDEIRSNIIGFSIMTMANDHPAATLALLTEAADLLRKDNRHFSS